MFGRHRRPFLLSGHIHCRLLIIVEKSLMVSAKQITIFEFPKTVHTMYIERFCEHFSSEIFYLSLEAVLLEHGYNGELYKKSDLPNLIEDLESPENEWRKLIFEDYSEMQEEVEEIISSNINNDVYLKKYICGIMRPFKEMSDLIYPSPESETEKLVSGRFLKDLHHHRLPREIELNEIGKAISVELRAQESFNSLTEEEKINKFNEVLKVKVS